MTYTATGTIRHIGQEQQVSDKFRKREFAIAVQDGNFTQYPKFELTQDKCSLLDKFKEGQNVIVSFNLRGNEYSKDGKTSYFTSLQAWRIEPQEGEVMDTAAYASDMGNPYQNEAESDLPF